MNRYRLAAALLLGGLVGIATAAVILVFRLIPTAERVMYLGAVASAAGLVTMGIPFFVDFFLIRVRRTEPPAWTTTVLRAGAVVVVVGVVLLVVGGLTAPA